MQFRTDKDLRTFLTSKSLSVYDKIILQYLATFNPSFPKQSKIANDLNISERQVRISLANLKEKKFIEWEKGNSYKKKSNLYSCNLTPDGGTTCLDNAKMEHVGGTPCLLQAAPHAGHRRHHMPPKKSNPKITNKKGSAGPLDEGPPLVKVRSGCADTKKISECVDEMIKSLH